MSSRDESKGEVQVALSTAQDVADNALRADHAIDVRHAVEVATEAAAAQAGNTMDVKSHQDYLSRDDPHWLVDGWGRIFPDDTVLERLARYHDEYGWYTYRHTVYEGAFGRVVLGGPEPVHDIALPNNRQGEVEVRAPRTGVFCKMWENPDPSPWNKLRLRADQSLPRTVHELSRTHDAWRSSDGRARFLEAVSCLLSPELTIEAILEGSDAPITREKWVELGLEEERIERVLNGYKLKYVDDDHFSGWGNYVCILHLSEHGLSTPALSFFGHLDSIVIKGLLGEEIGQGAKIGTAGGMNPTRKSRTEYHLNFGCDGTSTGLHVHFEGHALEVSPTRSQ